MQHSFPRPITCSSASNVKIVPALGPLMSMNVARSRGVAGSKTMAVDGQASGN
jgi:hypothetical protein